MMLGQLVLVTVHGSSRFPEKQSLRNLSAEEIATARSRHTSRRRRIPMAATANEAPSRDCRPRIVLSRTAQQWMSESSR